MENQENKNEQVIDVDVEEAKEETITEDKKVENEQKKEEKPKKNHKFLKGALVVGLAFVGGFGGSALANGLSYKPVVFYQQVDSSEPIQINAQNQTDVIARNQDTVVEIFTEENENFLNYTFTNSNAGSGVILSDDGYIVTNNHVVQGANKVTVKLHNGDVYKAQIIGTDSKTDLAVIKIEAKDLVPAILGDSDQLTVGENVVAIGNPLGTLGGSVTDGIVSALDRKITIDGQTMNLLQTNAQVSPGNSGGGLFNANGQLIGIVVAKSVETNAEGIGFVIPVNDMKGIVKELVEHGYVSNRPTLGIYLKEISQGNEQYRPGVYIVEVIEGSAAEKAGLQAYDRILAVDNNEVTTFASLTDIISQKQVGDVIEIQVVREGKTLSLNLTLQGSTK